MFFEKDDLSLTLLDTVYLSQKDAHFHNTERRFDAISFRFNSDAVIKTETQTLSLSDGSLCFFPANTDYERTAGVDDLIAIHFQAANLSGGEIEHFIPNNTEAIGKLFRRLHTLWQEKAPGYRYVCTALLYEIMAICHAECRPPESPSRISPALAYINLHLADPSLTVGKAAAAAYMSEVYFRKLFGEEMGVSPKRYIMRLRIKKAISLMATGYYSLTEVATLSGYTDYKYFSTEFKRLTGLSPSKYQYVSK